MVAMYAVGDGMVGDGDGDGRWMAMWWMAMVGYGWSLEAVGMAGAQVLVAPA